jgi:Rrf2 family protein
MRLQLTKRTDYAIRACVHLARAEQCPISSRRIAEQMEIPDRFLPQVMADLARAGIVGAVNGKNGGYCLRRAPEDISLLQVIEVVEGSGRRDQGAMPGSSRDGDPDGALHAVWTEAQTAFVDVLAGTSIAQIAMDRRTLPVEIGPSGPERTGR